MSVQSYSYLEDTGGFHIGLSWWCYYSTLWMKRRLSFELGRRVRVELFVSGRYGRVAHWTFMVVLLQHIVDEAEIIL